MRLRLLFLILTAIAGLTLMSVALAASTPSAPTITEPFTPLPCSGTAGHQTTIQIEGCAEQRVLRTDRQIDQLTAEALTAFHDHARQRHLIAAHNAWLTYRKALCTSFADTFTGGTAGPIQYAECEITINRQQITNLNALIGDLTSE
jgi:uncharacterized protein YecT (DUF1311 family)